LKLYIAEPGSEALKARVLEVDAVAVCRIAWAEAHAALSRRAREVPEDEAAIETAKAALAADWPRFVVLEIDQPLVERAGEYADTFACAAMTASSSRRLLKQAVFHNPPYFLPASMRV